MSWFAPFYDRVMAPTEEACLQSWRTELLSSARGDVLELGAGTGVNIALYPDHVGSVTFCEPDPDMRRILETRLRDVDPPWDARVMEAVGEALPFDDDSFDTTVTMLVLCSVTDVDQTLAELRRVTRPEGRLVFLEHVAADEGSTRRLVQGMAEPLWKRVAGNCHLTRDARASIARHFQLEDVAAESMRKAFSLVRPTVRGVATVQK